MLAPILLARQINHALGGAFVAPWDVDLLDDGTIEACIGLVTGVPEMKGNMAKVDNIMAKWRASHPTYRK